MRNFIGKYWVVFPLLLMCTYYIYHSYGMVIHDFGNYYFGSYLYRTGDFSTEIYAPCHFNTLVADLGFDFLGTYLPFTPITTLFFYPFSFFPPMLAKILFTSLSIIVFIVSLWRAFSFLKIKPSYFLLVPIVFFLPIRNGILFGQFYFILFALIIEAYLCYKKDWKWTSAVLLSIAISIKIFPVLLLFWFVSIKNFKQLGRIAIVGILLLMFSIWANGLDTWMFYIDEVLIAGLEGGMSLDYLLNSQSMEVFLKFLLVEDSYLNPSTFLNNYSYFIIGVILFKSALLALGFSMSRYAEHGFMKFGLWIFIALLIAPNGSTYSLLLLLIPLLAVLSKQQFSVVKLAVLLVLLMLLANLPWNFFSSPFLVLKFPRLFLMLALFSLLIFWYVEKLSSKRFVWLFAALVGIQLIKPIPEKSDSEIAYGRQSIICDYGYDGANLWVDEFNHINGRERKTILKVEGDVYLNDLSVSDDQIFIKKIPLTNSKDHKYKPMIIGDRLYYLSDYHQGYKFYNLRYSIPFEYIKD